MKIKPKILALNGSATPNSSNLTILKKIQTETAADFDLKIFDNLGSLPHFSTAFTDENTPIEVLKFRNEVKEVDGLIICTPEYVFSIPSRLKNAIEWCVSTTVFSDKPLGLITASANGEKGHEELKLIMKTVQAKFTEKETLLIQGVRGKINKNHLITDKNTLNEIEQFIESFKELIG